ncbi:glycosyltransferase [Roseomonas sp. CCTCC AB2023176]|uniref:glycosyltransferase n=1 Tax=Roseomonas sp. CCTCC AB2023176 TaxID=3342640 RepID=UPI0035E0B7C9
MPESDLLLAAAPALLLVAFAGAALPLLRHDQAWPRWIGAMLTIALMVRYLLWRATDTLPGMGDGGWTDLGTFVLAHGFFAVEVLSCTAGILLLQVLSRTVNRSAEVDAHPVGSHPGGPPLIDMLIPTYNEKREILERTIVGATAQDYPRFRVWVLDDGKRPWLADLAASHGAHYLTRADNAHGKAGNMNAALKRIMELPEPPDTIAVLDADFIASPQFLRRAAALLHDPKVACVQTPQFFFNPDPIQLNLRGLSVLADEQRFFFDIILASKDAHGTAFSCGTSALIRTRPLKEIGFFPTESVTEDLLLSIKFTAAGYRTVYLNEPLTVGLAPEGLQEYLTQRGRWCLGTMQILRTPWSPFSSRGGVPPIMRLHTLDTVLFWTVGSLMRVLCLVIPVLHWWFGLVVMQTTLEGLLLNLGPFWICMVVYLGWVSRGTNIPMMAEAIGLLVTKEAMRASVVGTFGSRNQKFKVTAKGASRDRVVMQWGIAAPYIALAVATIGGIAWRLFTGALPDTPPDIEAMNLFWSVFNLGTLAITILICVEQPRFRAEERFGTDEPVAIRFADGTGGQGRLLDLSVSGCAVLLAAQPACGEEAVSLVIPDVGLVRARVRRRSGTRLHLAFLPSTEARRSLIVKLFSGSYVRPVTRTPMTDLLRVLARRALS